MRAYFSIQQVLDNFLNLPTTPLIVNFVKIQADEFSSEELQVFTMCLEFSLKRAGIPLVRNLMHGAEGVLGGIPVKSQRSLTLHYKVKTFINGKAVSQTYVNSVVDGFQCKGDKK